MTKSTQKHTRMKGPNSPFYNNIKQLCIVCTVVTTEDRNCCRHRNSSPVYGTNILSKTYSKERGEERVQNQLKRNEKINSEIFDGVVTLIRRRRAQIHYYLLYISPVNLRNSPKHPITSSLNTDKLFSNPRLEVILPYKIRIFITFIFLLTLFILLFCI